MRDVQKDIAYMKNPDGWNRWPILPLVRVAGTGAMSGLLFGDGAPRVFLANMWEPNLDLKTKETVVYDSIEALAEEWRVD